MGELGEHIALALYIGFDGLDSYRSLCEVGNAHSEAEYQESMLLQDCVQCSFSPCGERRAIWRGFDWGYSFQSTLPVRGATRQ